MLRRSAFVPAAILLAVAFGTAQSAIEEPRKDKAAVMTYGGMLESPTLVVQGLLANHAWVHLVMFEQRGFKPIPDEAVAGRPCFGVAVFSVTEWAAAGADGDATDASPSAARHRLRVYPAIGDLPAIVEDPAGLAYQDGRHRRWPIEGWHLEQLEKAGVPVRAEEDVRGAGCLTEL